MHSTACAYPDTCARAAATAPRCCPSTLRPATRECAPLPKMSSIGTMPCWHGTTCLRGDNHVSMVCKWDRMCNMLLLLPGRFQDSARRGEGVEGGYDGLQLLQLPLLQQVGLVEHHIVRAPAPAHTGYKSPLIRHCCGKALPDSICVLAGPMTWQVQQLGSYGFQHNNVRRAPTPAARPGGRRRGAGCRPRPAPGATSPGPAMHSPPGSSRNPAPVRQATASQCLAVPTLPAVPPLNCMCTARQSGAHGHTVTRVSSRSRCMSGRLASVACMKRSRMACGSATPEFSRTSLQ